MALTMHHARPADCMQQANAPGLRRGELIRHCYGRCPQAGAAKQIGIIQANIPSSRNAKTPNQPCQCRKACAAHLPHTNATVALLAADYFSGMSAHSTYQVARQGDNSEEAKLTVALLFVIATSRSF